MRKYVLAVALLAAALYGLNASAAGEWLRESNVWMRGIVYAGTSKVALTNSTGNLASTTGSFSGAVSTGALTSTTGSFSGTLSVTGGTTLASTVKMTSTGTFTATGSTQGDGLALTAVVAGVVSPATTAGVILPAAATGLVQVVGSIAATGFKLYPAGTNTINATAASTAISVATGKAYECTAVNGVNWVCAGN